jgi:hypothetical protein
MTDEERDRLMVIEDEELRSWIRFIIFQRDVALGMGNRLVAQHAERAARLRQIEVICKEPW